ncbi:MAG: STAS domain-containing protein [Candidatus Hydrogenedentes bacterium]|nr:STAS domain-containing protein [Candidatus Hydrogenedentota bacterium]
MGLEIEVRDEGDRRIIAVRGEVDLNSSPELRKAVLGAVEGVARVGVDLSGATYMDSSGVATLVEGLKSASENDRSFVLIRPSNAVMRVLELARLDSFFDIRDGLEAG